MDSRLRGNEGCGGVWCDLMTNDEVV